MDCPCAQTSQGGLTAWFVGLSHSKGRALLVSPPALCAQSEMHHYRVFWYQRVTPLCLSPSPPDPAGHLPSLEGTQPPSQFISIPSPGPLGRRSQGRHCPSLTRSASNASELYCPVQPSHVGTYT